MEAGRDHGRRPGRILIGDFVDFKKAFSLLALALLLGSATGCATSEPENISERPWNAPKSWEHGLPTGMGQPGRY